MVVANKGHTAGWAISIRVPSAVGVSARLASGLRLYQRTGKHQTGLANKAAFASFFATLPELGRTGESRRR